MLISIFVTFLLFCVGIGVVFFLWLWLVGYVSRRSIAGFLQPGKGGAAMGLSQAELKKLPKTEEAEVECAVCLEQIQKGEQARVIPVCKHTFHLHCADTWLSRNPVCPVCRVGALQLVSPENV